MKVVISSGHGKHIRGAAGSPVPPYLDEVNEARKVVEETAKQLRTLGVETTTFHDDTSHDQQTNLNTIVNFHNSKTRDLDVSVHFNAYQQTATKPMGAEVLYLSQSTLADNVVDAICDASGLINRGAKKRTDLKFLNSTDAPAILIETAFVDSQPDADIYRKKFAEICAAIASSVSGKAAAKPKPPSKPEEHRTLSKGMKGEDVVELQTALGLPPDGIFGEITETQVEAFQASCDLDQTGVVDSTTWEHVDELGVRLDKGSMGLSGVLTGEIVKAARASPLMTYYWPGRGVSPPGYLPGMCLCFAAALRDLRNGAAHAKVMAAADKGKPDTDALSWYEDEFIELGMQNDKAGPETLRHLFVLLIGLAMRESSGKYCEGRDPSADNVEAETAEAGLLQA
jgi:N-acetylmuramoyl-L-alanine amidase